MGVRGNQIKSWFQTVNQFNRWREGAERLCSTQLNSYFFIHVLLLIINVNILSCISVCQFIKRVGCFPLWWERLHRQAHCIVRTKNTHRNISGLSAWWTGMPNLQSGMAPVSQSWSKYTKIIRKKVSHSPVYVSHSYHLGVALVGNATPERRFSDKNVSFFLCFSKISNFLFFIIRSCFYSRVVSLFGPSELPLAQDKWLKQHALLYDWYYPVHPPVWLILPSTPSCMIDITQHALKGQKLCKLSGFLKLLPLQGASLRPKKPRALPWAKSFCPFRACCLYWLLGLQGVLLILALNYPIYPSVLLK